MVTKSGVKAVRAVPASNDDELTVRFTFEKDTKNTRKYVEDSPDGVLRIGVLYVQKHATLGLNNPDNIEVTVKAV